MFCRFNPATPSWFLFERRLDFERQQDCVARMIQPSSLEVISQTSSESTLDDLFKIYSTEKYLSILQAGNKV